MLFYFLKASGINVKDFWVSEIKRILLGQFEKIKSKSKIFMDSKYSQGYYYICCPSQMII